MPPNGEKRGCKWETAQPTIGQRIVCDLAGARAQIHFCPDSIAPEKLDVFRNRLLLKESEHHLYSYTGWVDDLVPSLSFLENPDLPVLEFRVAQTFGVFIPAADQNLACFFGRPSVARAVHLTANALIRSPVIEGQEVEKLIALIEAELIPEDYVQVWPTCAR